MKKIWRKIRKQFFNFFRRLKNFIQRLWARWRKKISTEVFYNIYLRYCQTNVSYAHLQSIRKHLNTFWKIVKHRPTLSEISITDIEKFKTKLLETATPKSVNKYVKAMFNRAVDWGYITSNPARLVKPIKVAKSEAAYCLTIKEINKLLNAVPSWFYPIIYTFLTTGMRRGELINLRWRDVDMEKHIIYVNNREEFHTKNYKSRIVGMKQKLYDLLRDMKFKRLDEKCDGRNKIEKDIEEECVFLTRQGRPYLSSVLQKTWMKVRKELGVKYRLHDFRHTFCSYLILQGVDIKTVQTLMGHSDSRTTMEIYAHVQTACLREAAEKLPY